MATGKNPPVKRQSPGKTRRTGTPGKLRSQRAAKPKAAKPAQAETPTPIRRARPKRYSVMVVGFAEQTLDNGQVFQTPICRLVDGLGQPATMQGINGPIAIEFVGAPVHIGNSIALTTPGASKIVH